MMYKSRRAGKNQRWESRQTRETGEAEQDDRTILGATVTAIESHPKKPHMYRIVLAVQIDEESSAADWHDEVDALIASAQNIQGANEALLTVHEDTLVTMRLLTGRKLSAEEYITLKQDEQKEEAYRSAMLMLERKARTTAELSKALKRKGYVPEVIQACVERLQKQRMVDDNAYAKRFTEQRAANQRKGRMLIRQELLQRGVGREDVEQAIGELDGDVEMSSALTLARKKWPSMKGNDRERKQKLMAMLMRRGFPSSIVRTAVQQAMAEAGERDSDFDEGEEFSFESAELED